MTKTVTEIHEPASRFFDLLLRALRDGELCVVDVSQVGGGASMILLGLIFNWSQ